MEFDKSDIVESAGSSSSDMDLDQFLNNLNKNLNQINDMIDKADKTGNLSKLQGMGSDNGSSGNIDEKLNRSEEGSGSASSTEVDAEKVLQIIENQLDKNFSDDDSTKRVEQEIKGQVGRLFDQMEEGSTVGDLKEYLNNNMIRKAIKERINKGLL